MLSQKGLLESIKRRVKMAEKEVFPPQFTEGGLRLPYTPSDEEMENCGYAAGSKAKCPRKKGERQMVIGGPSSLIDCSACRYHAGNIPIK